MDMMAEVFEVDKLAFHIVLEEMTNLENQWEEDCCMMKGLFHHPNNLLHMILHVREYRDQLVHTMVEWC